MTVVVDITIELAENESNKLAILVQTSCEQTINLHGTDPVEIACIIADSDRLQYLNKKFRNMDMPTDVLAFPNSKKNRGDIAIALDIATRHAQEAGWPVEREVAYLATHATLHILGYHHDNDKAYCHMRWSEDEVLKCLGYLPAPSR